MSLVHEPECWPCVGGDEKFQHNSSVDMLRNPYRRYRSRQVHEKASQKPVWLEAVIVDSRRALFLSTTTVAASQRKKIQATNEKTFAFQFFPLHFCKLHNWNAFCPTHLFTWLVWHSRSLCDTRIGGKCLLIVMNCDTQSVQLTNWLNYNWFSTTQRALSLWLYQHN